MKAERSEAIDFRQGGRDRSHAQINFTRIKWYFRQRCSGQHACIRSLQQWTGAAAMASAQQARACRVVAAMGAVGKVSSRAAQAQAPASANTVARTITCRHASSSNTNVTDATKRVISRQCATAKSGSLTRKHQGKRKTRKRLQASFTQEL